jgi:hypothetical protein
MEHFSTSTLPRGDVGGPSDGAVTPWPVDSGSSDSLRPAPEVRRSPSRRVVTEGRIVFLFAFGLYLVIASLLDFKYRIVPADAFSRMANGFYVIYSRDPHLAAFGFVWEPLQSLADMVMLLGNHFWPALSRDEFAGSLVSAFAMAGAVYQLAASLREWGVSRAPRLLLAALFALDPMIVYYGGNGMSEALYLFTLVTSARYLLRWMRDGDLRSLAYSAVALAFCYLTRNEAALAALLGGASVGLVTYWRTEGDRRSRIRRGAADLVLFGAPAFVAALGWAVCSYVIIGAWIDGGSLSVRLAHQREGPHSSLHDRLVYDVHAFTALVPFLPILLVVAVAVAFWRRDPRIMAPLSVIGGALTFDMLSYLSNSIGSALRYWIAVIPLGVLLLGSLVAAIQTPGRPRAGAPVPSRSSGRGVPGLGVLAALGLVLVVMIPTLKLTASGMLNKKVGVEEAQQIGYLFKPSDRTVDTKVYPFAQSVDSYLESQHFPNGDVLVDNADSSGCVPQIVVRSSQPKLFVIPNDRDFQRTLADPIAFHTRYLLVPDPSGSNEPGEVNSTYPSLWKTGAGFAKQVHSFAAISACTDFRLFRVLKHSNTVGH